jgi:hypothetical protein
MRVQVAGLRAVLAVCTLIMGCGVPEEDSGGNRGIDSDEAALTHDSRCNEGDIRSVAPASATAFLDRAFSWVHQKIMYCQCPQSGTSGYRADCSGLVSFAWGLSKNNSTRQYPGGPYNNGSAVEISWEHLTIGDALNWHSTGKDDEGHIMMFAGWLDSGHTKFCSIEEYQTGKPAGVLTHSIYESWPTRITNFHPIRKNGYNPDSPGGGEGGSIGPPTTTPSAGDKFWVDTFDTANGYPSPGTGAVSGHLFAGTNYVFCKVLGPNVQEGSSYNHYWLKTDLDDGSPSQGQYVSAYYLSRWGNDVAKDNSGAVIPDCSGAPPAPQPQPSNPPSTTKYWVDTFGSANGYASPGVDPITGHLFAGTNYVFCKVKGPNVQSGSSYNHYWLRTDLDEGNPWQNQYISAFQLSRWGNDEAKDNNGAVIPDCN